MTLRSLSRKQIKRAIRSCEKRIGELKKLDLENAASDIHNERVKITVLMMRLEHPAIEKIHSLICPTCHEDWSHTNNDTHRFRCCPNCGRWFGKGRGGVKND